MTRRDRSRLERLVTVLLTTVVVVTPLSVTTTFAKDKLDHGTTGTVVRKSGAGALSVGGSVDISPASATLKNGLRALDRNRMRDALAARAALRRGTLERKVMAWAIALRGNGVDAATLSKIAADLKEWPGSGTIRRNVERAVVRESSAEQLRVAFSASEPETLEAAVALAKVHLASGDKVNARKAIASFWRNRVLSTSQERSISRNFKKILTREDHRARVEYLLSKKRIRAAQRIADSAGVTRLVEARAAVERKTRNAAKKLAAVPASQRSDPNYLFSKARYNRRKERFTTAANALTAVNPAKVHPNSGDLLWTEQRSVAAELVDLKKFRLAYKVVSKHAAQSARRKVDAEFYAGWIALRKLNDAKTAARHFRKLIKVASTPLSLSRGYYWLGRASAKSEAVAHYKAAAQYDATYYGQLAARKLGRKKISISNARPTTADRQRFSKYELVQAIAKLESAGHPKRARSIYRHLGRNFNHTGELALLAARAEKKGDHQLSLLIGKSAFHRKLPVDTLAWPIGAIPVNTTTTGAGLPLAYAISRQESTFQINARSHANALGLMQLLPTTARSVARKIGIRYSRKKLTTSARYNARLGTAYLGEQMKTFGGSYVLTFVAYNAGPSRARKWVKRNGDLRGASLDFAIDWVEQIPFSETRNYVQRVMENLQVYNARLNGAKLRIDKDLTRGRGT